jgi:hypothetical protein
MSKNKNKSFEAKKTFYICNFFSFSDSYFLFLFFIFYFFDEKNDETNEQQILAPSDLWRRHEILQDDTEQSGILPIGS